MQVSPHHESVSQTAQEPAVVRMNMQANGTPDTCSSANRLPRTGANEQLSSPSSPVGTHEQDRTKIRSSVRFLLASDGFAESGGAGQPGIVYSTSPRYVSVRRIRNPCPAGRFAYLAPDRVSVREVRPKSVDYRADASGLQDSRSGTLPFDDDRRTGEAESVAHELARGPAINGSWEPQLNGDANKKVSPSEGDIRDLQEAPAPSFSPQACDAGSFAPDHTGKEAVRKPTKAAEDGRTSHTATLILTDDAFGVKRLATKYADLCDYNMQAFKRSALRKELLCLANIKHRYGARPSSRFLAIFDTVMGYLYPTPRQQKKLTRRTNALLDDWSKLVRRYELVEQLAEALFKEALDSESDSFSPTSSQSAIQNHQRDLASLALERCLPRTTKALIAGAAMHLSEIRIQDAVMGRRGEAIDAQWDLLLAQLKQLDQVDLVGSTQQL